MILLVRGLTIAFALITFALMGREVEAHWFGNLSCATPATGTCTGGAGCTDYATGWPCTLGGGAAGGSWSVCISTYFSTCGYSPGCTGTLTLFPGAGCSCYGDQFSTGGC